MYQDVPILKEGLFHVQETVLPEWSSNSPKDLEHVSSSPTDSEEDENESDSSSENEI
jgi:hypothetical protein